jgi:putative spermidine/putrescine transport system permease protein
LLLAGPVGWLLIAYLGSLAVLFVASLWQLDDFSGEIVHDAGFQNFQELIETPVYRDIVLRTVLIAALVTLADIVLAFPIAFYMAKVASPRARALLVVAVLMPLWSSYLVKVYTWRIMLQNEGTRTSGSRSWCCRYTPGSSGSRTRCSTPRATSAGTRG